VPSVRDLRDRIRSLKNTQQITKAMKQVAAAKIRRAEALQKQSRPYADALGEMLRDLIAAVGNVDHPFMKPGRAGAPRGMILMTADKGLAGAFNANLIRVAELRRREDASTRFYTIGIKGRNSVRRWSGADGEATWGLSSGVKLDTARAVAARVSQDFVDGTISEIVLVSPKLVSMMSQRPETRPLLPVVADQTAAPNDGKARGAVEFEPSPEAVLSRLLPKYLEFTIYSAMLETDAAFFAAQLLAMNNATDNAKKMIDTLTIQMNNARQAAITKEILEIVGGAEALAG
jgi:F-type H+-transporting ATPase subunit gamma